MYSFKGVAYTVECHVSVMMSSDCIDRNYNKHSGSVREKAEHYTCKTDHSLCLDA